MAVRKHGTLVAATVATVALAGNSKYVEVLNRGDDDIFFTINGTDPTVAGDDTFACPAGEFVKVRNYDRDNTVSVKLISAATPDYSVALEDE